MQRKIRKKFFLFLIVIIAIAGIIIYQVWNEPHKNIKSATGIPTTATKLYSDLTTDSANMKIKLISKVLVVSGEIKQVSENQKKQQIILLKTNTSGGSVNCTMEENIKNIKMGDKITIKGICSGYIGGDLDMDLPGDVFLVRCYRSI